MANIEKIFLEARKSVGNLNHSNLSPLVTFDELCTLTQNNSLKEFLMLLSKKEVIRSLLKKYNLPYHFNQEEIDFQKINFIQLGNDGAIVPVDFKPEIELLFDNFYKLVESTWENQGLTYELAKEKFPIEISSGFRSSAYQAYTICLNSVLDEDKTKPFTKSLEYVLQSVALPYTSEHGVIPCAIDIKQFQVGKNGMFKSYDEVRNHPIWQLFKLSAKENNFIESYPKNSKVNFGNGEPWHFRYDQK